MHIKILYFLILMLIMIISVCNCAYADTGLVTAITVDSRQAYSTEIYTTTVDTPMNRSYFCSDGTSVAFNFTTKEYQPGIDYY